MTPSPEQEARAREVLFDHAASKPNWSLPEDKAVFSADTAIEAMLQFAQQCVEAERERCARIADDHAIPSPGIAIYYDLACRNIASAIRTQGNTND